MDGRRIVEFVTVNAEVNQSTDLKFSTMNKIQRITLLIFFFSINFEVWDPFDTGGYFSISKFTGFIYFFSILINFRDFFQKKEISHYLKPIWLFFAWLTIISLININQVSSAFFNFSIFQVIILFWLLINHERRDPGILERGMVSYAIGSVVLALCYFTGIGVQYAHGDRVVLFGDNENIIGLRMSISLMILLMNWLQNPMKLSKLRYLFLVPLPIMMSLLAATGSRTAFLSLILMLIAGVLIYKTKKKSHNFIILALGVAVIIFALQYFLSSGVMMSRLQKTTETGDLAQRDAIWFFIIPIIMNHPIFGIGETGYAWHVGPISPHNVLLEVLIYSGLIGFMLFMIFIIRVSKQAFLTYKQSGLILFPLLLVPVYLMILSGQMLFTKIAWVIFSYIAASPFSQSFYKQSKTDLIT